MSWYYKPALAAVAGAGTLALIAPGSAFASRSTHEHTTATAASAMPTKLATFTTAGVHGWTVPAGITRVTFDVYGAAGGNTYEVLPGGTIQTVGTGGPGGQTKATLSVTPGEAFELVVGGRGTSTNISGVGVSGEGGMNGGGFGQAGGGGGSDVRLAGVGDDCAPNLNCDLAHRIIVGGGGGGAGSGQDATSANGAAGGGVQGHNADAIALGGTQNFVNCPIPPQPDPDTLCGPFGYGGDGAGGGGGGGWYGGYGSYTLNDNHYSGGGGGGSGYISSLALSGSFPAATRPQAAGKIVVLTP